MPYSPPVPQSAIHNPQSAIARPASAALASGQIGARILRLAHAAAAIHAASSVAPLSEQCLHDVPVDGTERVLP
jgi:hypothetical protein